MRISDWSSDVCSSDLLRGVDGGAEGIDDRPWLGDATCAPAAHPDVVGRRLVEFLDGRRRAASDAGDDRADAEFEILKDADQDHGRAVGGLAGEREANADMGDRGDSEGGESGAIACGGLSEKVHA